MKGKYIATSIGISISIISTILFIIGLISIKIFSPAITILAVIFLIIAIMLEIYTYLSKNKYLYNVGVFIIFLINVVLIFNIIDLNDKYSYLNNIINKEYQYTSYNVYVQRKNTRYNDIYKLEGKKIGIIKGNEKNIDTYLNKIINIECKSYNNTEEITYAIENGEIQSFIISDEDYNKISSNAHLKTKTRSIYSTKIKETI